MKNDAYGRLRLFASNNTGSVAVVGALMAITAYGVEYTNCGPLAPKSRRCAER